MLAGFNDLATTHPDIAAMWHPRMNKRLKPTSVQAISRKSVWWRGECGHVYQMAVRDRVRAKPGYCLTIAALLLHRSTLHCYSAPWQTATP